MYRDEILAQIQTLKKSYLPEWQVSNDRDPGWAVAKIFSNILSDLEEQKEQLPSKLFIAYLDALNFRQNPPLSAKAPVVFTLVKNAKAGAVIPEGMRVGTKSKIDFETTEAIMASSAKLVAVIDYDFTGSYVYLEDHSEAFKEKSGMKLFAKKRDAHYVYFGDDHLFNIHKRKNSNVGLSITVPDLPNAEWQYYASAKKDADPKWYSFGKSANVLEKFKHYKTVKKEINGIESYWIRARVSDLPLPSDLSVNFESYSNVDALFYNDKPLYLASPFLPFGKIPQVNDSFYIASNEAFSKKGFRVEVQLQRNTGSIVLDDTLLSWEYWNGNSWKALEGSTFQCPQDISETKVNGELNYWVRVRLLDNQHYVKYHCDGSPELLQPKLDVPELSHINIRVEKRGKNVDAQYRYEYKRKKFRSLPLDEPSEEELTEGETLYFGFDAPFESGLISMYLQMNMTEVKDDNVLTWSFSNDRNSWSTLNVKDRSQALSKSGLCQFLSPSKQGKMEKFGSELYWIKAQFSKQNSETLFLNRIFMNAVEVQESKTFNKVLLGSSNGAGSQVFTLKNTAMFDLVLWVREEKLPKDHEGYEDTFNEGYWVRWEAVDNFHMADYNDRVYSVDSASGQIIFGDDRRGKIPAIGRDNIIMRYRTGGGKAGNVSATDIDTLVDSIAFVDSVINPVNASGGADLQKLEDLMEMAPQRLKHRNRATSKEDYFCLVRESSSDIAKVSIDAFRDRVNVYIVPFGDQAVLFPSPELLSTVQKTLEGAAPATVNVHVGGASYARLNFNIDIVLQDWGYATEMKSIINQKLEHFLHPLYGGVNAQGWDFGILPSLSDIYALFEEIEGIEFIEYLDITLSTGGDYSINDQSMPSLASHMLIANGEHTIHFKEGGA